MLAEKFAPMFPIDLVEKDFGYIADSASASSAHVPVANAARAVFAAAQSAGFAAQNITAITKLYS